MRKMVISSLIIILLIIGVVMVIFKQTKNQPEPKRLVAKFSFGKEGKSLGEFKSFSDLAIKDDYLFVADSGNSRIQILKINPDGSLSSKFAFGKEGKELGEFGRFLTTLDIRKNYLYVADTRNNRIQVLEIKY